jgi:hypothetical protein
MAYIDKGLLLKDIGESVVFTVRNAETSPELRGARKIIDRIENAPTADVVEVVRCKDCKYYTDTITETRCDHPELDYDVECYDQWINTKPTDFCSYGERKEQG